MCGLVGLAGNVTADNKDVINELLLVDVVRGHHSTGIAAVKRFGEEILLEKAPVPSPMFIGTKAYQDLINTQGLKCIIGHNRYATVGDKTPDNAHPFKFDNVVGAHNGTLDTWAHHSLENYKDFGTDSEAIYNEINKNGVKDTVGHIAGAWALTWFEKKNNSINLLRNDKRPLFYAYAEDRQTIYWASEADMLEWILKRHKIKLFENSVFECQPDQHYRWTIPSKAGGQFEKPVCAKIEGQAWTYVPPTKTYPTTTTTSGTTNAYGAVGTNPYHHASIVHNRTSSKGIGGSDKKIDTKKFRPPYKDAYGKIMNKVQFEALTAKGCVFCDENHSSWGDFIFPLRDDMDGRKLYLCEGCYNDDEIRELITNAI